MSMFLSKFLSGRNNSKSKLELLIQSWLSIQKYYETAADAIRDAIDLTPIPTALQNIVKLIQAEELEYEGMNDNLETGPCLEYLLQKRVLEELAEFAKVDTPFGMRIHGLRFFCSLVVNVNTQLLPERAVHVPLQKLISTSHRLINHHYEQLELDPEACSEERHTAISELSLELVKLMHGVFSHFKGANAALMDLFFERGWCRGLGENVWKSGQDGKTTTKRRDSLDEKIQWNMFLMPRFDMFTHLIDFMNIPGETGEIAREAILFALRLLDGDPEYVCYIVEYSGLCEVMAERLALLFALLPRNLGTFIIGSNNRVVPVRPPRRRIQFSIPAMITNNSLMITVNAHNSFRRKRRKKSPFDSNFIRTLLGNNNSTTKSPTQHNGKGGEMMVDTFYSFWEYLNDVARVADKRLMTALMAQLTTSLWHPVVCTALSSPSIDAATAATAYATEMIRSLTDQTLLHAFLVVLLGEEGGVGKDLIPELKSIVKSGNSATLHGFEEGEMDNSDDDEGDESSSISDHGSVDDLTLRMLLIRRMNADDNDLLLATLRLFDTMLETYNQFAIYNLVLRNYVDIEPDDKYVRNSITSPTTNSHSSSATSTSTKSTSSYDNETEQSNNNDNSTVDLNAKEHKTDKVRWLVERVLSLLPLEDELERMKSPPLSIMVTDNGTVNTSSRLPQQPGCNNNGNNDTNDEPHLQQQQQNAAVVPGNSYDDYFHEARERLQYGMLARNFWQYPYPPTKNRQDLEREMEDRKGRPKRPKSMVVGREAVRMMNDTSLSFTTTTGASSTATKNVFGNNNEDEEEDMIKRCSDYEGLFLHHLFDLFAKILESNMEQNLLVTNLLQKIAGIVDRRVDGVICDWRAIRVGEDGALYGGVWTLPTTTSKTRRSMYALLEQVTFEALKRAQLVPNFETRVSLAKKRGMSPMSSSSTNDTATTTNDTTMSAVLQLSSSQPIPSEPEQLHPHTKGVNKQQSLSQLVFNNNFNSDNKQTASLPCPPLPSTSKSSIPHDSNHRPAGITATAAGASPSTSSLSSTESSSQHSTSPSPPLPSKLDLSDSTLQKDSIAAISSPSLLFFQQNPKTTPITMTNPFAKLSNFVHAYIVLQEFCKELAAVVLVRHATEYPDAPQIAVEGNNSLSSAAAMMTRQKMMAAWHQDQYYAPLQAQSPQSPQSQHQSHIYSPISAITSPVSQYDMMDRKWKQRMSVATISTFDWRNGLDTIGGPSKRKN